MSSTKEICPRCKKSLVCQANAIEQCPCSKVQLSAKTREFLSKTAYHECLCPNCLQDLEKQVALAKQTPFPTTSHEFIEGVHYYKQGGFWVFTELYHIARGYCCQNGCKHCAYGFRKELV